MPMGGLAINQHQRSAAAVIVRLLLKHSRLEDSMQYGERELLQNSATRWAPHGVDSASRKMEKNAQQIR